MWRMAEGKGDSIIRFKVINNKEISEVCVEVDGKRYVCILKGRRDNSFRQLFTLFLTKWGNNAYVLLISLSFRNK
jgi:hypothetical protein